MKKIFTLIILLFSSLIIAQNSSKFKVGDTIYYDKKFRITTSKTYKSLAIIRNKWKVANKALYNLDSYSLDTVSNYFYKTSNYDTKILETWSRSGKNINYWKNGNKSSEGLMNNNRRDGVWTDWYKDGSKKSERQYFAPQKVFEKTKPSRLINFWNASGKQTVTKGTGNYSYESSLGFEQKGNLVNFNKEGEWLGFRKDGSLYYKEVYKKGKLKKGESWDKKGKKYTYKKIFVETSYSRGMKGIEAVIVKNFTVPAYAIENGIEGSMLVNFTVDKTGKVINPKVVRKLCIPCDKEALRIVSFLKKWKPAKNRGQLINVKYTLPLRIKL